MSLYLVSFDPGESTGVAEWDERGNCTKLVEIPHTEIGAYLQELETRAPKHIVFEGWNLWKDRNKTGDKQRTVRVIGVIEETARRLGLVPTEQKQSAKDSALPWAGIKKQKGHMPNSRSAYLHGYYWLYNQGKIRPRVLDELN